MRDKLIRDVPKIVVGAIGNARVPNVLSEMKTVEGAASALGLGYFAGKLQKLDDIHGVIQDLKSKGVNALFVCTDPLITTNADILNQWALLRTWRQCIHLGKTAARRV